MTESMLSLDRVLLDAERDYETPIPLEMPNS